MLIGMIIIIIAVVIDQVTKHTAQAFISGGDSIIVIPNLLEFHYFENTGASGGMLEGQHLLFMLVTVVALGIFGYLFTEADFKHKKVYSIAISMFIAGTLGNAIDRSFLRNLQGDPYVIDFLHYPFLTPILNLVGLNNFYNNLADMYLSLAIVLFAIDLFIFEPKRKKKELPNAQNNA